MAESQRSGWRRHTPTILLYGVLVVFIGVAIATAEPAGKSTQVCDRIPPDGLSDAVGEPIALTTTGHDGAAVRCDFGKPGEPSVMSSTFGINVAVTADRYAYVPDATGEVFTAVPGIGDAAHYKPYWGLIFRSGPTVVRVEVVLDTSALIGIELEPGPPVDRLAQHAAVARVVERAL